MHLFFSSIKHGLVSKLALNFGVTYGFSFLVFHIQILGVGLLYEMDKGKSSWWYPYLLNLPRSYDILAMFGEFEKLAMQVLFSDHILLRNG